MSNNFLTWYAKYKIHFLVWILYMLYETLSISFVYENLANPIIYISHYLVFIFFFYLHALVLLPFGLKNRKSAFLILPLLIALEVVAYIGCQYLVSYLLLIASIAKSTLILDSNLILRNSYRCVLYMGFSTGYYFLRTYLQQRTRTEELEKERLNAIIAQQEITKELVIAQNAFLKAQINPHFLFNTLDFVFHHVNTHSAIAGEAILRLSEMMRFAIDSDQMDTQINLIDEIEQVENLLYLHQIRKHNKPQIEFSYTQATVQLRFIPLVLLTLVENIFKHGDLTDKNSPAMVALDIENDVFVIYTNNLIDQVKSSKSNNSGLQNVKKRLNYAYGDDITFVHEVSADNYFLVKVGVPVKFLK